MTSMAKPCEEWWSGRELNPRPLECDSSALPTELPPRRLRIAEYSRGSPEGQGVSRKTTLTSFFLLIILAGVKWRMTIILAAFVCLFCLSADAQKKWRTYENCRLIDNPSNDGDSFHARAGNKRAYIFRLYFVDAPESDTSVPDRLTDQAAYWGTDEKTVQLFGKEAAKFTEKFLANGFTAHSRLIDAMGRSEKKRNYAIIRAGDKDLGEELVRNGLGRVHGKGTDLPEGTSERLMWGRLRSAEREAKAAKRGVWGAVPVVGRAERFDALNVPPDIPEQDLVLPQTVAVYSTMDANRQVGILQRGAEVRVLNAESPTMVRIRFSSVDGKPYEALCRMVDIGL